MRLKPKWTDTAEAAFTLAKILREDGYLWDWTSDLAQGLDKTATALNASIIAFKIRPSFRDYGKLEDLAGETWLTVKQDLLQTLPDESDWGTKEVNKANKLNFLKETGFRVPVIWETWQYSLN